MRIGIEAHVLGRRETGNERVMANLIRGLDELDEHELFVYVTDSSVAASLADAAGGRTTVRSLRASNPISRLAVGLPLAARRDRLDVLLAHVNRPLVCPSPVVSIVHDVSFARMPELFSLVDRAYMNVAVPLSIRRSDRVITCSEFSRREMIELYGTPADKVEVLHWGVDGPLFINPPGSPPIREPPYFLAIGNLQRRKNLSTLLGGYAAALDNYPALPGRLVIVGQDRFGAEAVRAQAHQLREAGRVVFTGYVSDEDLVALLRGATAFAFPSLYEGFGFPPLEAMAVGTPVVASDIPTAREILGDAALRVPASDTLAWRDVLMRMSTEPSLREDLSRRGFQRAAGFTWAATARRLTRILEDVVNAA